MTKNEFDSYIIYFTDITANIIIDKFPDKNPNPVLKCDKFFILKYYNKASKYLIDNDYFRIKGIRDCESPLLKVYNRWGDLVYYSIYPSIEPWDGFSNNNEVIEGTYFYILKLKYKTFKGVISVFR